MPTNLQLSIIIGFIAFIAGAYLFHQVFRFQRKHKIQKRRRHGEQGESLAKKYLIKQGFEILDEQVEANSSLYVNDQEIPYKIRADFLVERNDELAIVEVKTGKEAPKPQNRSTRRQLLEYSLVYDVDCLYLFNAETKSLQSVEFPHNSKKSQSVLPWICALFFFSTTLISLYLLTQK